MRKNFIKPKFKIYNNILVFVILIVGIKNNIQQLETNYIQHLETNYIYTTFGFLSQSVYNIALDVGFCNSNNCFNAINLFSLGFL